MKHDLLKSDKNSRISASHCFGTRFEHTTLDSIDYTRQKEPRQCLFYLNAFDAVGRYWNFQWWSLRGSNPGPPD